MIIQSVESKMIEYNEVPDRSADFSVADMEVCSRISTCTSNRFEPSPRIIIDENRVPRCCRQKK